ncbi:MAG: ABC transporter ATP-binding protein [Proteobacteria bacterium SG_bin7]|nr:MAG: ABC transporter ATP-binding protein [Proteobacteria bacterium SG_bin7]
MLLLSVNKLAKSYASKTLFKNVSFGIKEGDRIGLLGPNGAGKSTLVKILLGQSEADDGEITFKKGLKPGYLEQSPLFENGDTIISAILSKCKDQYDHMADAYTLIAKLGLSEYGEDFLVKELSGGWQKRVALARELVLSPDLLFLDEPTNHLDVSSIIWLEDFLRNARFTVFMITHDRLFLQRVATRIMDLSPQNPDYLLDVGGDYVQYLETKEQLSLASQRHEKVLRNTLRREVEWLRRGAKARQTKQTARIEATHKLANTVADLSARNQRHDVGIEFGDGFKSPKKLIEAVHLEKEYGKNILFSSLDLLIGPTTRLALMGDNGMGKSTLIRVLLNLEKPTSGTIKHAEALKFAYFEQNKQTLDPKKTVLKNICPEGDYVDYRGQKVHVRSYLDRFLFFGQRADLEVHRLSGGEQARLRLAQLMLQDANVLVLDEPTNDLDIETLDILESALKDFPGAVILVTHDRYFMDSVANKILGFPIKGSARKELISFANYEQWENWFLLEASKDPVTEKPSVDKAEKKQKLSFNEKFELENMEKNILKLEETLETLKKESESAEIQTNAKRLTEIHLEMAQLQENIDKKYERWSELEKKSGS